MNHCKCELDKTRILLTSKSSTKNRLESYQMQKKESLILQLSISIMSDISFRSKRAGGDFSGGKLGEGTNDNGGRMKEKR